VISFGSAQGRLGLGLGPAPRPHRLVVVAWSAARGTLERVAREQIKFAGSSADELRAYGAPRAPEYIGPARALLIGVVDVHGEKSFASFRLLSRNAGDLRSGRRSSVKVPRSFASLVELHCRRRLACCGGIAGRAGAHLGYYQEGSPSGGCPGRDSDAIAGSLGARRAEVLVKISSFEWSCGSRASFVRGPWAT